MTGITAPPVPVRVGMWRAAVSGWRVSVPVVLADAAVQAATVAGDPVPQASWGFGLLVAVSALALVVAVWLVACTALAAVDGRPRQALALARRRPAVAVWALGLGVVAAASAWLQLLLPPLVLVLGVAVLPAAADGARSPLVAGFRPVLRAPVRWLAAVLAVVVLAALSWVVALVLGLFVTGVAAAAAVWVWFGVVGVVVLCLQSSLYRRVVPEPGGTGPDVRR